MAASTLAAQALAALLLAVLVLAGLAPTASAEPGGGAAMGAPAVRTIEAVDPRIRTLRYDPDRVVRLDAYFGFQLMIQFSPDERIENVSIGDGAAWQVTPNHMATLLFVKPVDDAGRTNMTVVTDQRSYLFELDAHPQSQANAAEMTYVVRFLYPPAPVAASAPPPPPPPAPPTRLNTAYTYTGSRALLPSEVFDDGRFTYFKWPENAPTPALFAVGQDGAESLVNYSFRDGYEAVEQVAPRFRLRDGKTLTTVINEAWRPPAPGVAAPQPHDAKTAREARREAGGGR